MKFQNMKAIHNLLLGITNCSSDISGVEILVFCLNLLLFT